MKKIAFIVSGLIGRKGKILEDIQLQFGRGQYHVDFFETRFSGHARQLSAQVFREGYSHIIAVGGDGTFNEVANGVFDECRIKNEVSIEIEQFDTEKLKQCVIGLFPAGSGNDFSRTANILKSAAYLKLLIDNDNQVLIDVGIAVYTKASSDSENGKGSRIFLNVADVGMGGAATFYLSNMKSKSFLGPTLLYAKAIIQTFLTYKKQNVTFIGKNFSWQGKIMSLVMANGKYFGSGLGIAPNADLTDGQLSGVVLGNISVRHYLAYLPKLRRCELISNPQIRYFNEEEVEMQSLENPLYMQMDGELVGTTPVTIGVLKQCIKVLMPEK
ncbi:MAG: hypothetical protein IPM47_15330 [Sphingobacteriales bacterium]|nr:MAG: hypothetical protein IPM47_15330 [Sphingobacteriales bacterium]